MERKCVHLHRLHALQLCRTIGWVCRWMSRECHPSGIPTTRDIQAFTLRPHIVDELCNKMFICQVLRQRSRNIRPPAAQSRLREIRRWLAPPALWRLLAWTFHAEGQYHGRYDFLNPGTLGATLIEVMLLELAILSKFIMNQVDFYRSLHIFALSVSVFVLRVLRHNWRWYQVILDQGKSPA